MQSSADGWSHAGIGLGEVAGWRRDLHVRKTGGQLVSFVGEGVRGTLSWAKIVPGGGRMRWQQKSKHSCILYLLVHMRPTPVEPSAGQ